jgi:hypothetical protein
MSVMVNELDLVKDMSLNLNKEARDQAKEDSQKPKTSFWKKIGGFMSKWIEPVIGFTPFAGIYNSVKGVMGIAGNIMDFVSQSGHVTNEIQQALEKLGLSFEQLKNIDILSLMNSLPKEVVAKDIISFKEHLDNLKNGVETKGTELLKKYGITEEMTEEDGYKFFVNNIQSKVKLPLKKEEVKIMGSDLKDAGFDFVANVLQKEDFSMDKILKFLGNKTGIGGYVEQIKGFSFDGLLTEGLSSLKSSYGQIEGFAKNVDGLKTFLEINQHEYMKNNAKMGESSQKFANSLENAVGAMNNLEEVIKKISRIDFEKKDIAPQIVQQVKKERENEL